MVNLGGVAYALMSAALFGISTPLAKLLLGDTQPATLAGLFYLGSGLGLALVLVVRRGSDPPLCRGDLPWLAAIILAGGVAGPLLLMLGLSQVTAASASLLLNLEGFFTLVLAWVVFRENVDRRVALGAAAILSGAVLLSWQDGEIRITAGALAVAGACLAWGIDNNLTRKLSSTDPVRLAMLKGLVAGPVNLLLGALQGAALPGASLALAAGLIGFTGYGVSLVLFVLALRHLGTARTGAYFSTAPFLGAVLSLGLLGEPLTTNLIAAGGLMAIGVALHLMERHEHEHAHEALAHEHRHAHDAHHQHAHATDDPPGEPHSHRHVHARLVHRHPHYPDIHHRHEH